MAIILPSARPAIDIVQGSYSRPEPPWQHLGDPDIRGRLQTAIASVGRLDYVGHSTIPFGGTAFIVGHELMMTNSIGGVVIREGGTYHFRSGQSAMVDFERELLPADPVRFIVQEVVYFDERFDIQLLRVEFFPEQKPLPLSVRTPDELLDCEVAVIGYPAFDVRSDGILSNRIFRETYNVKRLLPGKILGSMQFNDQPTLIHDCTTTGGCGGAPLIDLKTGEVLGIHFAGNYLKENYAVPSRELALDSAFVNAGVSFAGPIPTSRSTIKSGVAVKSSDTAASSETSEAVSRPELQTSPLDVPVVEIRLPSPESRPAYIVENGRFDATGAWKEPLSRYDTRLSLAVRAVGKVRVDGSQAPWAGTAFMVGERLAVTASYVAAMFADGVGENTKIRADRSASIDFSDALGIPQNVASCAVPRIRFIHPFFSVALLELDETPRGVATLDLAGELPSELSGRELVVISFAGKDVRHPLDKQNQAYGAKWDRLFVQPGTARQLGRGTGKPPALLLIHDCLTNPGSGGAPVIDLATGYVVGIHTAGTTKDGYAQPTWELARDPHVWDHPIRFRPDPRPSWLDTWNEGNATLVEKPPAPDPEPANPSSPPNQWTVDQIPINWSMDEPQALEKLLAVSIDSRMALYMAENAGLQLGLINPALPPLLLWREILKKASIAGLLRRLVEAIADSDEHAGIADRLRTWL